MESTIWPTLPKFDPTKDRYVRPFSSTPLISSSRSRQGLSGSAHPLRWTLYRGSPTTSNPGREALGARCPAVIGISIVLWSPEGLGAELSAYLSRAISPIWTTWMGRTARCLSKSESRRERGKVARLLRLRDADECLNSIRASPQDGSQRYASSPPRVGYLSTLSSRLHIAS